MTPWLDDGDVRLFHGDALEQLALMPSESVHCTVTSPPFYSLRDYGVDGQIGLEDTLDGWLASLVAVFAELKRVLRSDGTLFLEIGDTYVDKQLAGAPWRLAFALQGAGWFLRSDCIWARLPPNPMPESVTDRPTKAHSYVFLLSKSARYFFDADAIREQHHPDGRKVTTVVKGENSEQHRNGERWPGAGRNARSVWSIATEPTPFAHFATFPQALVERCVKAGTSEHGACSECGAPWRRITQATGKYASEISESPRRHLIDRDAFAAYLRERRAASGLTASEVDARLGTTGYSWWEGRRHPSGVTQIPSAKVYPRLKEILGVDDAYDRFFAVTERVDGAPDSWAPDPLATGKQSPPSLSATRETLGWEPSCRCHFHGDRAGHVAADRNRVPCVVLDPFMGSGTTALVARRLGRHAIGIELNLSYLEISATRLQQLSLLGGHT